MRTEGGPSAIRVSCSLNMKDMQRQNSFAFVPKSDYSERWHLENKCLFHNQQLAQGEKCEIESSYTKNRFTCTAYPHYKDRYKPNIIENMTGSISHHKSGDWKYDEEIVEHCVPRKLVHEPESYTLKLKSLYSISDLEKSHQRHRFASENNLSTSSLQDAWKEIVSPKTSGEIAQGNYLQRVRECLANYQQSNGIPRTEYSFSALIKRMGQATGQSLLALLYVILNIIPVAEVFLYVLRFILDKMISIKDSEDFWQMLVRIFVFLTELSSVYICLLFLFGFIIVPIVKMVIGITAEILL
ncbi:uncharacterized protein LOC143212695 [Lasioglossum baleicum]|uniref:uncharacterized protein LOC143212695 n=1 Tax=Lasioglossum baleicum TaxID=434251 RepID=UPI003FCDB5EA